MTATARTPSPAPQEDRPDQTVGTDQQILLEVRGLSIAIPVRGGVIAPAREVHLQVPRSGSLGIVGESGSGKSMTLRAVLGLVPEPARVVAGQVLLDGQDLVADPAAARAARGRRIGMIFQDPMASLNPVLSVGSQLVETLQEVRGLGRARAWERAGELVELVGIRHGRQRLRDYPHQFSGGMAQRVMIALALAAEPDLLLADEPTTGLDVSVQDQVLTLLESLRQTRSMSMVMVSHDMGVIARACDQVAVMYGGRVVEVGPVTTVLHEPAHPYTRMLLATMPTLTRRRDEWLPTIGAGTADLSWQAVGCPFAPRCPVARSECATVSVSMELTEVPGTAEGIEHTTACPFTGGTR